jgi:cell wall-associated NlpC family hydrolase
MNDDILRRAISAIGKGTIYVLGKGGRKPIAELPGDSEKRCDCSGFVSWCVGLDRYQPRSSLYKKYNGGWISTDAIVFDAKRPKSESGYFTRVEIPTPGDIIVYGDKDGRQGHTGIVSAVRDFENDPKWAGLKVIHCSSGNYKKTKDAIRETGAEVFLKNKAIFARFDP